MNKLFTNDAYARLQDLSREVFASAFLKISARILSRIIQFFTYKLGVKNRYFFTRHNHLRLRYVVVGAVFLATVFSALTLASHNSNALGRGGFDMAFIEPAAGYHDNEMMDPALNGETGDKIILASAATVINNIPVPLPLDREVVIQSGDALGLVMEKQGVGQTETAAMIKAMKGYYDPRKLKVGQKIIVHFDEDETGENKQRLREMKIQLSPIKTLIVARAGDSFKANIDEKTVKRVVKAKQATIEVSLSGAAHKAGIPAGVIADAIHIFSWNVDFQRDIRSKDTIEIMYESYETEAGYVAKNGNILYAKLTLSGQEIPLYRFKMSDGRVDYFQPNGMSIKRTLMKTPINGARMSSGFGRRRHPVLGYTKMHKGIDFAASRGTPIFAAGDGVIEKAGWFSSYGKYVRIRHNSKLKTAYAHMSKLKTSVGKRVKQGQIIGYVGTTGRSTGPHLHYEVLSNGRQVNPRSVNLPTGEELRGKNKTAFKAMVRKVKTQFASALEGTKMAQGREMIKKFFN